MKKQLQIRNYNCQYEINNCKFAIIIANMKLTNVKFAIIIVHSQL